MLASYPSAVEVAELFAGSAGCSPDPRSSGGGLVSITSWMSCAGRAAVRLVRVEGGGHVWFAPGLGTANEAVDATALVTEFVASRGRG